MKLIIESAAAGGYVILKASMNPAEMNHLHGAYSTAGDLLYALTDLLNPDADEADPTFDVFRRMSEDSQNTAATCQDH